MWIGSSGTKGPGTNARGLKWAIWKGARFAVAVDRSRRGSPGSPGTSALAEESASASRSFQPLPSPLRDRSLFDDPVLGERRLRRRRDCNRRFTCHVQFLSQVAEVLYPNGWSLLWVLNRVDDVGQTRRDAHC